MMKRFQNIRTNIFRSLMVVAMIVCGVGQSWGAYTYNGITYTPVAGTSVSTRNEGYASACDGDNTTKMCVTNFSSAYVIIQASEAVYLTGYNIITGNDNASYNGRNPQSWTIEGCDTQNGTYETIVTVTNDDVLQDVNYTSYSFTCSATKKYQYFKFTVTAVESGNIMQFSEFNPLGVTSLSNPTSITATPISVGVGESSSIPYSLTPTTACYDYVTYSSSDTNIATVDNSTGQVTGVAKGTATITLTAHNQDGTTACTTTAEVEVVNVTTETGIGYVITYQNAHFLGGTSTTDITTFNPSTCLWTGSNGSTWKNGSNRYLRYNNGLSLSTNSSNWTVTGTESGTTGQSIYYNNTTNWGTTAYYIYYSSYTGAWETTNYNTYYTTTDLFSVTRKTYPEESAAPTITGDDTFESTGDKTYTYSAASYKMGYYDYVFYSGAHHYFKTDNSTSLSAAPTAESFTYTWSLSNAGDGHVTIDSSTGEISYSTLYTTDTQGTLTLTATSANKTYPITKTITFKSKLPTTLTFASEAPTISGSGIQLPAVTLKDNNGDAMSGAITYSGEGCSVSSTGVVTNITGTSATVTASYAGNTKYAASTATYTITATSHAAVNDATYSDITIDPASAKLDLGKTQAYTVPETISAVTRTCEAYTEYTFPVGKLYKKSDNSLTATEPIVTETTGVKLNFAHVQWTYSQGGRGNYFEVSSDYSATSRVTTLTRSTVKTDTDLEYTITATVVYGTGTEITKTATAKVIIPSSYTDITAIYPNPTYINLGVDETYTIVYTTNTSEAGKPYVNISYSSANTNIATVDQNGVITGVAEGQTTVTIHSTKMDGTAGVTATVTVVVSSGDGSEGNPYKISSVAGLEKMVNNTGSHFIVTADFDASSFNKTVNYFSGTLDGQFHKITGLTQALFNSVSGGTVKNVILDNVSISGDGNRGAIANEASGSARIYNCGVLGGTTFNGETGASGSTISGTNAGSIVGYLSGNARVINCYSYANVSGTTTTGGIVGNNSGTTVTTTNRSNYFSGTGSMVFNCIFFGSVSGTNKYPVFGGTTIENVSGVNTYNYFRYDGTSYSSVNSAAGIVDDSYISRFDLYRGMLNSHRDLCAMYINNTQSPSDDNKHDVALWLYDYSTKTTIPYLQLEQCATNTRRTLNRTIPNVTEAYKGKQVGTVSCTFNINGSSYTETLPMTDMNKDNWDYTWGKIVLPFANEFTGWSLPASGSTDYDNVITGWEITSITGGTAGSWDGSYDMCNPLCTAKDLYSNNKYVWAQGGNYVVPTGVTAITFTAHIVRGVYLADSYPDIAYNSSYTSQTTLGTALSSDTYNGKTVYHSLTDAYAQLQSKTNPADQAIVLVGNYHYNQGIDSEVFPNAYGNTTSVAGKAATIMSIDADNNQVPDYAFPQFHNVGSGRTSVPPLRFDFVCSPGIGISSYTRAGYLADVDILHSKGWFEVTETGMIHMTEYEIRPVNFSSSSPLILNGGIYDRILESATNEYDSNTGTNSNLSYIRIGGKAYVKQLWPGYKASNISMTINGKPINVSGGQIDECYLTGETHGKTISGDVNFYCNGGYVIDYLGAYQEKISGNVTAKIDHALIDNFYGGGADNAYGSTAQISGDISNTIDNSYVKFYCAGPKVGTMASDKTVTTSATGTTFGQYYGAGYGGTALTKISASGASPTYGDGDYTFDRDWSNYTNNRLQYNSSYGTGVGYAFLFNMYAGGNHRGNASLFVNYATLSLASTYDVSSTLNTCTVESNFYGGGCQGMVNGTITNSLTDCSIYGSVFGGGYKASATPIEVYPTTQPTYSVFKAAEGLFTNFGTTTPETYTWVSGTDGAVDNTNKTIGTSVNMSNMGKVTGQIETTINNGTVGTGASGGSVYGGGNESPSTDNTIITINGTAVVNGSVYGGGNLANVTGSTTVNVEGGTVNDAVYGGGALANTGNTTVNLTGGTVKDVYGGGLGRQASGDVTAVAATVGSTTVNVGSGTVSADVSNHGATNTDGTCKITGSVFGCNNLNATPTGDATVNVFKTTAKGTETIENPYHVYAVFGGGNKAAYDPEPSLGTSSTKATHVNIYTCNNLIQYVYGGGNAASVPAANLTIWGGKFDWVFGGGNGKTEQGQSANPGANVGYYTDPSISDPRTPGAAYGSGEASTAIHDGIINHLFGGSNTRGNIRISSITELDDDGCDFTIGEVYAAGNEAYQDGTAEMHIGCIPGLGVLYGGARKADINNDVQLNITSGTYGQIFGGNNESGSINGSITVNIEETGCNPIIIGEVYGGGNQAAYTGNPTVNAYSFTKIGNVYGGGYGEGAVVTGNTTVNVQQVPGKHAVNIDANGDGAIDNNANALGVIGTIFGGGNAAKVDGSTNVNIGTATQVTFLSADADDASWTATKTVLGANIQPTTVTIPQNITGGEAQTYECSGNVFGGGNNAEVTGKTNVVIGPQKQ